MRVKSYFQKIKDRLNCKNERGFALMFALAIFAALLILCMTFVLSSGVEQQIAALKTESQKATLLADTAANKATSEILVNFDVGGVDAPYLNIYASSPYPSPFQPVKYWVPDNTVGFFTIDSSFKVAPSTSVLLPEQSAMDQRTFFVMPSQVDISNNSSPDYKNLSLWPNNSDDGTFGQESCNMKMDNQFTRRELRDAFRYDITSNKNVIYPVLRWVDLLNSPYGMTAKNNNDIGYPFIKLFKYLNWNYVYDTDLTLNTDYNPRIIGRYAYFIEEQTGKINPNFMKNNALKAKIPE